MPWYGYALVVLGSYITGILSHKWVTGEVTKIELDFKHVEGDAKAEVGKLVQAIEDAFKKL